ncbi:MAG: hypothetical protein D6714_00765 [Bacteroidetes bacterium]|nr:MAG: hypothetical protein D6714_00765 [Bacteroidota bacterium]
MKTMILFAAFVLIILFWLRTLLEISRHSFSDGRKVLWLGVVLMMPVAGMLLYYAFGRRYCIFER